MNHIAGYVGRYAIGSVTHLIDIFAFNYRMVMLFFHRPLEGRAVIRKVIVDQIYFTAVEAFALIIPIALIIGSMLIVGFARLSGQYDLGKVMVLLIVRELGPLLTAALVASRSGTAIAAELATNRVMGEMNALEGLGIDPLHYLVLPRFGAVVLSTFGLTILFDLVALFAGLVAATSGMSPARYFDIVLQSLTFRDVWVTLVKGLVFGAIVGLISAFHGLRISGKPTEVPIASSRAVVGSIVAIFIGSGLFVLLSI